MNTETTQKSIYSVTLEIDEAALRSKWIGGDKPIAELIHDDLHSGLYVMKACTIQSITKVEPEERSSSNTYLAYEVQRDGRHAHLVIMHGGDYQLGDIVQIKGRDAIVVGAYETLDDLKAAMADGARAKLENLGGMLSSYLQQHGEESLTPDLLEVAFGALTDPLPPGLEEDGDRLTSDDVEALLAYRKTYSF